MIGRLIASMVAVCVLAATAGADTAAPVPSSGYWALFDDGQAKGAPRVDRWEDTAHGPVLAGRRLTDPRAHVRILYQVTDRSVPATAARIVLANGDVLPGRVRGFAPADGTINMPDRLIVLPTGPLAGSGAGPRNKKDAETNVEIRADAVARVFTGRVEQTPPPGETGESAGALLTADGRRIAITSLRWTADGLRALTDDGIVRATFEDVRELTVPKVDRVSAVLADGQFPPDEPDNWIVRMRTADGAVLTYREALRESRRQKLGRYEGTVHSVRPAWALVDIRVPEAVVAIRDYRRPTEVPLSLMPGRTVAQRSFTGFVWAWRTGANVRGGMLRTGELVSSLGVGTHSFSQVAFDLPPHSRSVCVWVGLDRAVGNGGCVRCAAYADSPKGRRLWHSGWIMGSEKAQRVGPLNVGNARAVVLETDFGEVGPPAGADPADIRDEVDWIAPTVTVDAAAIAMTREALARCAPCLEGWEIAQPEGAALPAVAVVPAQYRHPWRVGVNVGKAGLTLSRRIRLPIGGTVLDVSLGRPGGGDARAMELMIDGQPVDPGRGGSRGKQYTDRGMRLTYRRGNDQQITRWIITGPPGSDANLTLSIAPPRDAKPLAIGSLGVADIVADRPADGKLIRPAVALADAELVKCVNFPESNRRREKKAKAPTPERRTVLGVPLDGVYAATEGMRMTYRLKPEWRRFVAVVGPADRNHRGPLEVRIDGKVVWQSGAEDLTRLQQAVVDIPAGAKAVTLTPASTATGGVWAMAGFMTN